MNANTTTEGEIARLLEWCMTARIKLEISSYYYEYSDSDVVLVTATKEFNCGEPVRVGSANGESVAVALAECVRTIRRTFALPKLPE